jgi:GNAT superfamily N-acetyltransferase
MSYQSIVTSSELPSVIPRSDAESARFGLEVGRLELGPDADVPVEQVNDAVERSTLDVIVLRYPAAWIDFPARLAASARRIHQADTLMYYRAQMDELPSCPVELPDGFSVRHAVQPSDRAMLERAVRAAYENYGSHYRSNPLFAPADILEGYVEWALRATFETADTNTVVVCDPQGVVQGFLVVSEGQYPELQLGGVTPSVRRRGIHTALVRAACERIASRGGSDAYTSSQVQNLGSQRTWIRLGFRPELALNTVHFTRSSTVASG